jgi:hypothetical protein
MNCKFFPRFEFSKQRGRAGFVFGEILDSRLPLPDLLDSGEVGVWPRCPIPYLLSPFAIPVRVIYSSLLMKGLRERHWPTSIIAVFLASVSAAIVFWQNARLAVLWDLSYVLENAYRISLGQIPYRDFPFPYAPLTFLIQAALIKLTGRVFFHHVIYCAVINLLSTLLTWRVLLRMFQNTGGKTAFAIILTVPLTVLGVYSVFPHPFYDCDCTFIVLVCLLLLVRFMQESTSNIENFCMGIFLVLPLLTKQNTGLFFIIAAIGCLALLFLIDVYRRHNLRKYIAPFAGLVAGLGTALLLLHRLAGLHNYYQWTFKFAAQRRTPPFADMIGMYRDSGFVWWLVPVVFGLLLLCLARGSRIMKWASVVLMLAPFVWPVIYLFRDSDISERAERLVNLWPLVLILSVLAIVQTVRRGSTAELVVAVIIIVTVHGAFMSQQLWGSTYALWPLFMILIAFNISALDSVSDPGCHRLVLASVMSISLVIAGAFYIRSHERLDYAELDDGDLTHSSNPALKGLSTRGSWLTDFDQLVAYSNKEIPKDAGLLCLPGEDLFYYTTGRVAKFPVLMFDHTINPYSPQQIVDIARGRNIQWLIVKNELQLQEEPIEKKEELMNLLMQEFESVESLDNYEIYRRKSKESDEEEEEDNK